MVPQKWLPDLYLIHKMRHGNREAFTNLYDRHASRIYSLLNRLSGCVETAEDLTQETFVAAYRSLPTYEGRNTFAVWLQEIALRTHSQYSQYSRQSETGSAVSSSPIAAPSDGLRTRTIQRIADIAPPRLTDHMWTGLARNTAIAGIVALGVTVAFVFGPRWIQRPASHPSPPPIARRPQGQDTSRTSSSVLNEQQSRLMSLVHDAVNQTNSWHIVASSTGGKTVTQKREVWECVKPYFRRQQDNTTTAIDDGVTLTTLFPMPKTIIDRQTPTASRPSVESLALMLSSDTSHILWGYGIMDEGYFSENLLPQKLPPSPPVYGAGQPFPTAELVERSDSDGHPVSVISYRTATLDENSGYNDYSLTVDTATHLPRHYESHRYLHTTENFYGTTTTASYNLAIPAEVMTVKPSPTCHVVDLRGLDSMPASLSSVSKKNTRLQARVVEIAQDDDGNVRLVYDLCDNGQPYSAQILACLSGLVQKNPFSSIYNTDLSAPFGGDEFQQAYVLLGIPEIISTRHVAIWLTPATPCMPGKSRPKRLTVHLPVGVNSWTRWISFAIDLPINATALPAPTDGFSVTGTHRPPPLPVLTAIARANFFSRGGSEGLLNPQYNRFAPRKPGAPPPVRPIAHMRATNSRAAYWWVVAATESDKIGDHQKANAYRMRADQVRPVR